jgi:hypothetical protein
MQWTTATLLDRLLTKLEASGTGQDRADVMAKPELVDDFYPKGSDLIVFLKEQIVREAMAPRNRPVTPAKKAVKRPLSKPATSGDVTQRGTTTTMPALDLTNP